MNPRALVAAVVILAVVAPAPASSTSEKSTIGSASGDIGAFNSALALYQVDTDSFPTTQQGLHVLLQSNVAGWSGPYMATISPDPWGFEYQYESDGADYTISLSHTRESGIMLRYNLAAGQLSANSYRERNQKWMENHLPLSVQQGRERTAWVGVYVVVASLGIVWWYRNRNST